MNKETYLTCCCIQVWMDAWQVYLHSNHPHERTTPGLVRTNHVAPRKDLRRLAWNSPVVGINSTQIQFDTVQILDLSMVFRDFDIGDMAAIAQRTNICEGGKSICHHGIMCVQNTPLIKSVIENDCRNVSHRYTTNIYADKGNESMAFLLFVGQADLWSHCLHRIEIQNITIVIQ